MKKKKLIVITLILAFLSISCQKRVANGNSNQHKNVKPCKCGTKKGVFSLQNTYKIYT